MIIRFLHSRILLFRPLLLHKLERSKTSESGEVCRSSVSSTLQQSLLTQSWSQSTFAAQELILLIGGMIDAGIDNLPETWYIVFCKSSYRSQYTLILTLLRSDMYTCGMILLVGHLCLATESPASGGSNHSDDENRSAWTKCLDVLRLYQESSHTARKCLRLLELSETRFWPSPIHCENQRTLPSRAQLAFSSTLNDVSMTAGPGFNMPFPHQQEYQSNSLLHSAPLNLSTMTDNSMNFENPQPQNNHQFWMEEPIDMAWLNALPFEISFEDTIYGTF